MKKKCIIHSPPCIEHFVWICIMYFIGGILYRRYKNVQERTEAYVPIRHPKI